MVQKKQTIEMPTFIRAEKNSQSRKYVCYKVLFLAHFSLPYWLPIYELLVQIMLFHMLIMLHFIMLLPLIDDL